jgi:hypothetical protein
MAVKAAARQAAPAIKLVEQDEPPVGYGRVEPPYWDTVAIIGGGPSLIDFDFERLRGATVLAVKGSIFDIPWADAGFGLDMARYNEWRDKLATVPSRIYWAVPEDQLTRTGPPPSRNITFLRRRDGRAISTNPGEVYDGGTSGFAAFQIALHKRAKRIVLIGFDYDGGIVAAGDKRGAQKAANWKIWAEHFGVYVPHLKALGVSVVNACPHSAISCFQKMTLDDGVRALTRP